jgi:O-antigen/teichoic acid export membrane protein
MFVSVFEYAWKPFYLAHYNDADAKAIFAKVLTTFSIASMILILLWSFSLEFIVRIPFIGGSFINPAYWSGLNIVPIILFGYFFNGIFTNLNAGFLIEKKTKYLPLIVGLSALSNIIFLFLLVPKYGFFGGAWATFLAYLLQAILVFYYSNKIYPIKYEWKKIMLITIITATFILSDKLFFSSNFDLNILIIIRIVLIIIYLSTLFIFGFLRKLDFSFMKRKS